MFFLFYLKTKNFQKSYRGLRRKFQEMLFLRGEPSEKIEIKRAWGKNSNLPSPFSNLI
jgi:hypothetical protein